MPFSIVPYGAELEAKVPKQKEKMHRDKNKSMQDNLLLFRYKECFLKIMRNQFPNKWRLFKNNEVRYILNHE